MELPIPAGLPLPVPPEHAYAKGMLIAWAQLNGGPTLGYGKNAAEFSPVWSSRDSVELRGFREWWNKSNYTPKASANTGQGTDVTYPTPADIDALTAWGQKTATTPPAGVPPPVVPPGVPPAVVTCASGCEKQHGFGSNKPDPVAFATCIAACGGQLPGGGSAPGGGAGGTSTPISCPEGFIFSAGVCQPKPTGVKTETPPAAGGGVSSNTGLLIAGAVVLAAVGLFAATVGAAGGAAVAGGRSSNPKIWRRPGELHDYRSGRYLRQATQQETDESIAQAKRDGGAGVILVDGRRCYVEGGVS
jgi:hypothetical protein